MIAGSVNFDINDGEYIEIEADLINTAVLPGAKDKAGWEMNTQHVEFSVEIEDVPVGSYTLKVGGIEEGNIETFEMHDGEVFGHIDPKSAVESTWILNPGGRKLRSARVTLSSSRVACPQSEPFPVRGLRR